MRGKAILQGHKHLLLHACLRISEVTPTGGTQDRAWPDGYKHLKTRTQRPI
jgi:hypothetical protein